MLVNGIIVKISNLMAIIGLLRGFRVNSQDNLDTSLSFDYEDVESVLADADCDASAAEVQAFFCGMLAAGLKPQDNRWQSALIDLVNDGHDLTGEAKDLMHRLFHWSASEMSLHETLAPVFLPDDSYPPIDQLEALIDWSQGFLLGFGLQTGNEKINNEEVNESLTDLAEICRLDPQAEDDEETQEALVTLIEHIKVAVQIIHWELVAKNTPQTSPSAGDGPTVH